MQVYSNYAKTQLITGVSDTDTSLSIKATEGGLFQDPTVGEFELVTLTDGIFWEVVKVTDRVNDVLTVTRGHEGVARSWLAGTVVKASITEDTMNRLLQREEVGASFALFAYQNYR